MTMYNLVGVPIPIENEIFSHDKQLIRKLEQISDLVEIKSDINEAKSYLDALFLSHNKENKLFEIFLLQNFAVIEALLLSAIVTYSKSFNTSTGRASLKNKKNKIFVEDSDLLEIHNLIIDARNKIYAHRESNHNQYNVMCFFDGDNIKINPNSNNKRRLFAYGCEKTDLEKIEKLFNFVIHYLESQIQSLCTNIESNLSQEQINYIRDIPNSHLVMNNNE